MSLLHYIPTSFACIQLLVRKFVDPVGGDINYSAFIQAVDEEYIGQVMEEPKDR